MGIPFGEAQRSPSAKTDDDLEDELTDLLMDSALMPSRQLSRQGSGVLLEDGPDGARLRAIALAWCEDELESGQHREQNLMGLRMALQDMNSSDIADWVRGLQTLRPRALP